MAKVNEVLAVMERWAPVAGKMSYDNVGLLVGSPEDEVKAVLVTLDITPDTVAQAEARGANLILSHHPIIFKPLYSLSGSDYVSETVRRLIKNGMSAICMHTNLDAARDGVSDALAQALELENVTDIEGDPVLRQGLLHRAMSAEEFAEYVSRKLNTGVKYTDGGRLLRRVAVCGGAGGGNEEYGCVLAADCDAYVSGEFKHHILLDAKYRGITVVDGGHFATEWPICRKIAERIEEELPGLEVTVSDRCRPDEYIIRK